MDIELEVDITEFVPEENLSGLNHGTPSVLASSLLKALFQDDLKTHSRTGRKGKKSEEVKPQLDLKKQAAFYCKNFVFCFTVSVFLCNAWFFMSVGYMKKKFPGLETHWIDKKIEYACKNASRPMI